MGRKCKFTLLFCMGTVVGVDSYNVYVDGVYATNVNGNSVKS